MPMVSAFEEMTCFLRYQKLFNFRGLWHFTITFGNRDRLHKLCQCRINTKYHHLASCYWYRWQVCQYTLTWGITYHYYQIYCKRAFAYLYSYPHTSVLRGTKQYYRGHASTIFTYKGILKQLSFFIRVTFQPPGVSIRSKMLLLLAMYSIATNIVYLTYSIYSVAKFFQL
jgi:hypothetical protein